MRNTYAYPSSVYHPRPGSAKYKSSSTLTPQQTKTALLHTACQCGNLNLVRTLLTQYNYSPFTKNANGDTPLHCACISNVIDIVELLVLNMVNSTPAKTHMEIHLYILLVNGVHLMLQIPCSQFSILTPTQGVIVVKQHFTWHASMTGLRFVNCCLQKMTAM